MSPIQTKSRGSFAKRTLAWILGLGCCLLVGPNPCRAAQTPTISKTEFDTVEGLFHDALGTYAEVTLANELILLAKLPQPPFDASRSKAKLLGAVQRLPPLHPQRNVFLREIANIEAGCRSGALALLARTRGARLTEVRHVPREFAGARAGDLRLELAGAPPLPVSVKTDKSGKVAVAEGQTPLIGEKWAERYFQVSNAQLSRMISELGFPGRKELTSHYLNVARLVAAVLIEKLGLRDCLPTDFSKARVTNMVALKYLLHQLLAFKNGRDGSRVIILDRSTGEVKWESLLDGFNIDALTADRITFLPSHPRGGRQIGSEFGLKIDGKTVVSFQIKHRRGEARGTKRQAEFSDITTRLRI